VSTPAFNSMIIIAGISLAFTEIVVLFSLSEYDRHAKDLCPHVYISAKSDPKDMGIWSENVLYECEIWCIIFKKQHRLKERDKKLLSMTFRDTKKEVTGK
jgi:hypothetical protein